ncbi:MAG: NADH:ubiquinone oxidoreductase subunit J [Legionellales bacterium]|jgi:NADH-quinone oxidoreductase subunit J|nr:NADH:ubiquinone oxidoreductase subunit J [Legionellales bacterium]MBK68867.1 NADH:ubiquinone oxidoreductase subunit J [Legionellales bacterium]|tara:strand:+ start:1795 stop:2394 length:600 start_codon:yes stop_codon:yes gene_type:complete
MTQIIFYFFSAILLFSATMVVAIKNPIHAALFLVLSFFSTAAIWLLLNAEFLAIALVLVYVGAVMVLFLFVIMMLDINVATLRQGFARYFPLGIIIAFFMVVAMGLIVSSDYFLSDIYSQGSISTIQSNTKLLGLAIYQDYLYHFEIAGAILLVAIIAAISLCLNKSKITKSTQPDVQVLAKKDDRLRVVKMKSEEKED